MPAAFVVDASVVVEFLAPGAYGAAADRFVGALAWPTPIELLAPDLLFLEVANTLRKLVLRKGISSAAADRSIDSLGRLAIATVASTALLRGAWSLRGRLTIYDASYVALAEALRLPFVTADRALVRACRGTGVRAWVVDHPEFGRLLDALEATAQ